MKKHLTLILLVVTYNVWSQPINDDCGGIIDLGVAPICSTTDIFTNVDATASDIGTDNVPGCFSGLPERDVWFSFVAADTILEYTISVLGCPNPMTGDNSILNPEIAIYRGDICAFDELVLLSCASAATGSNDVKVKPPNLTPGITYYVRVTDWTLTGNPNWGAFKLCVEEVQPVYTIDMGGSTECSGEVFDTGGENGNYGSSENHVFTICPTEPHGCINFTLKSYNIQTEGFIDKLIIYDGDNINAPQIGLVPFIDFFSPLIGNTSGGTGYKAVASSGCMTLQFISDSQGEFEGFHGVWECIPKSCTTPESISVKTWAAHQDIIDNIATPQTTVTIDTIICDPSQYGTFEAPDNTDLGMEKGLILTTGYAFNAVGPNVLNEMTTGWDLPGDDDLNALDFPNVTYDACVVELDVFVIDDELTFEYIFASEEFPEFVNQAFNDVFAFFISGPGITGNPVIGGQENIALLPGTNSEVSINNVNHTSNWEYYHYNGSIGDYAPQLGKSIEYDGMTTDYLGDKKSLTARKKVLPCNTYHLKLVVADKGDTFFDSGVFISEVRGGTPELDITFFNGLDYLVEDCTLVPDQITLRLPAPDFTDATEFMVVVGGTAMRDEDYTLDIPSTVTFLPGQTELTFPITTLPDGVQEGTETIEIRLVNDFGCGEIEYATLNFEIQDNPRVKLLPNQDTLYICPGESIQFDVDGASQYHWSPQDILNNNLIQNPLATPTASTSLVVVGSIGACEGKDSIWLEVVDPQMDIEVSGDTQICEGEEVTLTANNNAGNTNLIWSSSQTLSDPEAPQITVSPSDTTTYTAEVSFQNCFAIDTVTILVEPFDFPQLTTTDTTLCANEGFQLAENISASSTTFNWSPSDGLTPSPSVSGPTAMPTTSTIYTLTATSENGICVSTADVNIEVLHFDPSLEVSAETITICAGEETTLSASTGTFSPSFFWLVNGDTISKEASLTIMPDETTNFQIIATDMDNECFFDETMVEVIVIPSFEAEDLEVFDADGNSLGATPSLTPGQTIFLEINTDPNPINGATYEWSIDNESPFLINANNSTGAITVPFVSESTTLTYAVLITDGNDCIKEALISVDVEFIPVGVSNIFTPDGDGLNDVFRLGISEGITIQQFNVYNRWGQLVYQEKESWDGNYKGEPAPSDVYIYHIIYQISATNETVELKGDLTLIR